TSQGDEATFQEAFAYLEGGFGRVEIGGTDGAAFKMHYTSPWFVPGNGVDSPNIFNSNGISSTAASPSTYALSTEDAPKISYFTPRLSGFQLGASYTPDAAVHDPFSNGFGVSPTNNALEEVFEIAGNYAGEIGSVELGVDVFYVTGEVATATLDPEEIGIGASLGFAGFTLGGAYKESQDLSGGYIATSVPIVGGGQVEETVWTVGLAYGTGPWTVGVAYIESELESGTTSGNSLTTDFLQVGGGYSLGAGVDLGLDIQFINNEAATAGGSSDDEATSAGVVLAISF
ncbi:MAG: porin, partial [Parvibaculaceae bacterium]|nr:porin [Parvibaculaceae bacterium]